MKRKGILGAGVILIVIIFTFTVSYNANNEKVIAESLRDSIKKSMKETEKQKEAIRKFRMQVYEKFREEGYEGNVSIPSVSLFSSKPKQLTLHVKNKSDSSKEMKQIIKDIAKSNQLGKVEVTVKVQRMKEEEISEEAKERRQLSQDIFEITSEILQEKGYKHSGMNIMTKPNPTIEITIDESEENFSKNKKAIEKLIHNTIYSKKKVDYNVKVEKRTEAQLTEEKWYPILGSIREETNKNFDKVTGYTHSFNPAPLQITIKTSLSKGWTSNIKAKQIKMYVHEIIDIKREELSLLKEEPYKIIIHDKGNDKLNWMSK
ncbi:hypothetical protein [Virgibacillus litoralis]|uniref:DUF4030 domain-containing protein n=1 Tax=Virgibacillus litoralis TaxID=578221 RepID=A0ABS4HCG8_9BACI|nr:hypothetical protein [Virgibacillus litoralis]MBP1948605.1 hypothetical protein [Virgibacillus litoralis]